MAPLLRIVEMKCKRTYGKMHETPHAPLYVPLQKKHLDTVEINIMTDTGEPAHFAEGKTVTVLEFKRIGLVNKVVSKLPRWTVPVIRHREAQMITTVLLWC